MPSPQSFAGHRPFCVIESNVRESIQQMSLRKHPVGVGQRARLFTVALLLASCDKAEPAADDAAPAAQQEPAAQAGPSADALFQADADTRRLVHLKYYAELIEAYHAKTGRYPLQGRSSRGLNVFVSNPDQRAQMERWTARGNPDNPTDTAPFKDLIAELAKGLEREVPEYYDPQRIATDRPNFYIYLVTGDAYFFAVHVSEPYPFAKPAGKGTYKVEVGSRTEALRSKALFDREAFQAAIARPLKKPAFFDARDAKYLHATLP